MSTTFAADMKEMMAAWDKIRAAAKAEFPGASEEEIYQISAGAMNNALGFKPAPVKPAPVKVPRIYSGLQFTPIDGGKLSYSQILVAAMSQAEAVDTMRLEGTVGEIFVLTDEAVQRGPRAKWQDGRDRFDPPTLEDHARWVRIQTRGSWDGGIYCGPTYTRFYLGPIAK